ncbi:MAG: hypoxanthine phosphoribosyltransferase [Chloroflexi bacterium]|nr:hypoxanthine phosphoribosyltransferase [Chloroflexota bacterium]
MVSTGQAPAAQLRVLVSEEALRQAVARLAAAIDRDYAGKQPVLVGVLKGSFIFLADLVRRLSVPVEVDFVRVASYGTATRTSGQVRLVSPLKTDVRGRDVVIVEDVIDSALTVRYLLPYLRRRRPASLRVCAMFLKETGTPPPVPVDYLGMTIPNVFVVGYGLDYAEQYRQLPDLRVLE